MLAVFNHLLIKLLLNNQNIIKMESKELKDAINKSNEEKAKFIADQCKPCTDDFYSGIYQGVLLTLNTETPDKILNCYQIQNGNASATSIIFSTSKENALKALKDSFECETFETFEDYNSDNPDEFENEEKFDEWNFDAFYSKYPKGSISIEKIEQKEGLVIKFSEDFY